MEEIKRLFSKNIRNRKMLWIIVSVAVVLIAAAAVVIALFVNANSTPRFSDCTITVKSEGGIALEGIGVSVYTDASKEKLVGQEKTDANGTVHFGQSVPIGSIAVLEDVPAGYNTEEAYSLTRSATKIVLSITLLEEMTELTPGCVMFDFTVTATNGRSYTLSSLLKKKKAVVLNLWYTGSRSCEREFIFLQKAFDMYAKNVAVLGISPNESDDDELMKAFKEEHSLTIPMARVGGDWKSLVQNSKLPTTIIIDRFGTVGLIHTGPVGNLTSFTGALKYFTADDYVQSAVDDISTLKDDEGTLEILGTEIAPLEFEDVTEFEVPVPAGQTVFCNLYQASGKKLQAKSENLRITFHGTEYPPVEGTVSFLIPPRSNSSKPDLVCLSNTGAKDETFEVVLVTVEGSVDKPIKTQLGQLTVSIAADNPQSMCYTCSATANGTFVLTIKNPPADVDYSVAITNQTSQTHMSLEENAEEDKDGNKTLSVSVMENDDVLITVSTLPNEDGQYPAAQIGLELSVQAADSSDETEPIQIPEPEIVTDPIVDNGEAA